MSLEQNFKGKGVLVTGAGRGIGRALVERLHSYGAIVYALSRNPANLEQLEKEFKGIRIIPVDIQDWEATKKKVEAIEEPIHCLINNAAILIPEKFLEIKPESFDITMNTNMKAVINVSQVVAKKMINNKIQGSIVNISSIAAIKPHAMLANYCTSKAALDMLTRIMASELAQYKIRVNAINLGGVNTDMCNDTINEIWTNNGQIALEDVIKQTAGTLPLGEFYIEMDQVVNTILFVGSNLVPKMIGSRILVMGDLLLFNSL